MKKTLLITLTLISHQLTLAHSTNDEDSKTKSIDPKKYCYYADLEYSKGAEMIQAGTWKRCVYLKDTHLNALGHDEKDLIWVSIKANEPPEDK